jgi:hypothetical protein
MTFMFSIIQNWIMQWIQISIQNFDVSNIFSHFSLYFLQWLFVSSFNRKTFKIKKIFMSWRNYLLIFDIIWFYVLEIWIQFEWWQSFVNIVTNSLSFSICAFNKILLHNISFFEHIIHKSLLNLKQRVIFLLSIFAQNTRYNCVSGF